MNNRLLSAAIFCLAAAIAFDGWIADATAQDTGSMVCEEGFTSPTGIKRDKVTTWMTEQHSAGRVHFESFGVQGTVRLICAW